MLRRQWTRSLLQIHGFLFAKNIVDFTPYYRTVYRTQPVFEKLIQPSTWTPQSQSCRHINTKIVPKVKLRVKKLFTSNRIQRYGHSLQSPYLSINDFHRFGSAQIPHKTSSLFSLRTSPPSALSFVWNIDVGKNNSAMRK